MKLTLFDVRFAARDCKHRPKQPASAAYGMDSYASLYLIPLKPLWLRGRYFVDTLTNGRLASGN